MFLKQMKIRKSYQRQKKKKEPTGEINEMEE